MFGKYAKPMATFNAVRFRSHFGTFSEVLYNLMTFGISVDSLPISRDDGSVKTDYHLEFIKSLLQQQRIRDDQQRLMLQAQMQQQLQRQQQIQQQPHGEDEEEWDDDWDGLFADDSVELPTTRSVLNGSTGTRSEHMESGELTVCTTDQEETCVVVLALKPTDVILGRGAHNKTNPGNLRLKLLLDEYYDQYHSLTNKSMKTALVNEVMKKMQDAGSRFVYEADDSQDTSMTDGSSSIGNSVSDSSSYRRWLQATSDKIRDKISHDLRNMKRAEKNSRKKNLEKFESKERMKRIIDANSQTNPFGSMLFQQQNQHHPQQTLLQERTIPARSMVYPPAMTTAVTSNGQEILTPTVMDIIMGRNKKKSNLGNMLLKELLEEYYDEYEAANAKTNTIANPEKMAIVKKVLTRMDQAGARFLVSIPQGFYELASSTKVHDKITQDMRNMRWSKKKKAPEQQEQGQE
jgi:hypothetical protein